MNLPIEFPNDADVIAEEATRFRTLSPANRVRTLGEMVDLYYFLASNAAQPETVERFAHAQEERGRQAIEEFIARHG